MEKRDVLLLTVLLGGGGYFAHANWPQIAQKLGLDDLYAGRIKAIELAKKQFTFDRHQPNGLVLEARRTSGLIEVVGEPWQARRQQDKVFLVVCTYRAEGKPHAHHFKVDLGTEIVEDQGDHPDWPGVAAPPR